MDITIKPYELRFKSCIGGTDPLPRKITITVVDVVSHTTTTDMISITFSNETSCQIAKDVLGDDWAFASEKTIYGKYVDGQGYLIQRHYFQTLHQLPQ